MHAGVVTGADERKQLDKICRYVARPAVSEQRVALTRDGRALSRMCGMPRAQGCAGAALVLRPRVNLARSDAHHPWGAAFGRTSCVQIHSG